MNVERVFSPAASYRLNVFVTCGAVQGMYNGEELYVEGRRHRTLPSLYLRFPLKNSHGWSPHSTTQQPNVQRDHTPLITHVCVCSLSPRGIAETSEGVNEVTAHLSSSTEFSMRKRWSAAIWSGGSSTSMMMVDCVQPHSHCTECNEQLPWSQENQSKYII